MMNPPRLRFTLAVSILSLTIALALVLAPAQKAEAAPPSTAYELLYEDHFDGIALNLDDWFYRTDVRFGGHNLPGNVRLGTDGDGNTSLYIDFKYEDFNNSGISNYTSGGIISRKNFGYGYYEVRAKLYGETKGLHQSFWSMGMTNTADVQNKLLPASNRVLEIDGFETDSISADHVSSNGHWYIPSHSTVGSSRHDVDTTEWFILGYEWLPGKLNFYVNGELVRTMNFALYYAPQNVWLTALATPEAFGGAEPPLPGAAMQVDYFRYYGAPVYGNWIGNYSFEYQLATPNPQNPISWIETGDAAASLVDDADAYSGSYSLLHYSPDAYEVTTKQILDYIPNSTYKLTAWVKSSGGQAEAAVKVLDYGGAARSAAIPAASGWTQIVIDQIEVTDNKAVIAFVSDAGAGQWLRVDDVVLEDVTVAPPPPEPILVDNGDPGYAEFGAWLSSSLRGSFGSTTRYAGTALGPYVQWTPNIPEAGEYGVYIYKVANTSTDPNAKIDIVHSGGTNTVYVDYAAGQSGWVFLGSYPFSAGTAGYVQNTLNTSGRYIRADAVLFVPVHFYDGFESGQASAWTTTGGSWAVVPDGTLVLEQSSAASAEAFGYAGENWWSDYTVEAEIKPTSTTGYIGLTARFQDTNNFYHFRLNLNDQTIQLYKRVAGAWSTLGSTAFTVNSGSWYKLAMELDGSSIRAYADDTLVFDITDTSLSEGRIGVRSYGGSFLLDEVRVWP